MQADFQLFWVRNTHALSIRERSERIGLASILECYHGLARQIAGDFLDGNDCAVQFRDEGHHSLLAARRCNALAETDSIALRLGRIRCRGRLMLCASTPSSAFS